jgi:hypothetical protein
MDFVGIDVQEVQKKREPSRLQWTRHLKILKDYLKESNIKPLRIERKVLWNPIRKVWCYRIDAIY